MAKQFWINLPVKDLKKSKIFFTEIGFVPNPRHENRDQNASFYLDEKKTVMMLFPEKIFSHFAQNDVTNTKKSNEVFLNLDAQSTAEVDQMAIKVKKAGGTVFAKPIWQDGWMYLCGFQDLDGHRWGVLHMAMDKLPK